ncbi:MAG: MFS transporter [Candidatus Korobacteraceae bacterium]|jgi:MFS family permease
MESSNMAGSRTQFGPGSSIQRSGFRWVVLLLVCLLHFINFADRANIGVAIPSLRTEFHITNFQLGQMASIFFLGYFVVQIPAGWLVSKFGVRGLITSTIIAFSAFTALVGASISSAMVMWSRFGLGIVEAPTVVATNGSIKTWFPSKERGVALGCLTGITTLAVAVTPIAAAWILKTWGWRYIFYFFAIPGVIFSVFWYILIRRFPQESPHVNAAELEYIQTAVPTRGKKTATIGALGWFDKFLRAKKVSVLESNGKIFASRNIWGVALTYLFIQIIFYGIATWVPSYLLNAKHYSIMRMGWVAATPWLGGVFGNFMGGWINDKFLYGRCKPMMMVSGLGTLLGMWSIVAANSPTALGIALFVTGIFANCGWASYFGFPMAFTTGKTYPVAISVMIMGGNIGAFLSPMSLGWLLDHFKGNYNVIFIFMGIAALLSFLSALIIIDEPVNV